MTEKQLTLTGLIAETASLNYQLLQLQIDQLENELIVCIDPLKAMLETAENRAGSTQLNLHSIKHKLTRLQLLRFELNQANQLCQIAA
ncbi:MAG: hypothetical protein GQF41_2392 [Candidatus Rifleibacterium amylolyticum]|nr:MAG: hypothetical protein GQF41_2392 [Candidatus Rifleibacterium amylolyticum]NLF96481.1 hypothetical protein [Candidatus Riflebacteria bacterium]